MQNYLVLHKENWAWNAARYKDLVLFQSSHTELYCDFSEEKFVTWELGKSGKFEFSTTWNNTRVVLPKVGGD
jgi:hypothetical protein